MGRLASPLSSIHDFDLLTDLTLLTITVSELLRLIAVQKLGCYICTTINPGIFSFVKQPRSLGIHMDGISDAASLVTLVQLAAGIINYVRTVIDAPVQKRKLLAALIQARGLLSTLVELTNEVEDEDWSYTIQNLSAINGPLSTFRELLEHIARKLGVTSPGSKVATALHRLRWPFDQTSLQEIIATLENLKSTFLLAMENDHIRLSKAIRNELHQVQRQLAEATIRAERQTILSLSKEQELIVNSLFWEPCRASWMEAK